MRRPFHWLRRSDANVPRPVEPAPMPDDTPLLSQVIAEKRRLRETDGRHLFQELERRRLAAEGAGPQPTPARAPAPAPAPAPVPVPVPTPARPVVPQVAVAAVGSGPSTTLRMSIPASIPSTARRPRIAISKLPALPRQLTNRRILIAIALVAGVLAVAGGVIAFFVAGSTANSYGATQAGTLDPGNPPDASATGRDVTVSWDQNAPSFLTGLLGNESSGGYLITRYAENDAETPIAPATDCDGLRQGGLDPLSCTEEDLPTGHWQYTVTPKYYNWLGAESTPSDSVTIAPEAPTSVSFMNGAGAEGAYINNTNKSSLSFDVVLPATSLSSDTITLTLTDPGSAHTVTATTAGTSGAETAHFTGVNGSSLDDGTITVSAKAKSAIYNDESSSSPSITVTKDTTNPSNALSLDTPVHAFLNSGTLYYKGNATGSFNLADTVTDGDSGPASASFPAISTSGWTHAAETVSTPSGGPYTSSMYSWTASPSNPADQTITGSDNAANTADTSLQFVDDSAAPTGGSITANGSSSPSYNTTGTVPLSKTDFTDGESGVLPNVITRASGTLTGNSCGTLSGSTVTTISGGNDADTLAIGCYQYTLTGTDNVGNTQTALSAIVKVDTTPPSTPTLAFGGLSSKAFYDNGFNTLYVRPSTGGTFTVTASSTDADTGIQGYTFNSLNTNGGSNFGGSQTGDHFDYTFSGSSTAPTTPRTVFATNNAGADSANANYALVSDTTAPTGGSITANGGNTYSTSLTVSLSKTNFAETQSATESGLAGSTNVITRATATLNNNSCGSFSGAVAVSTPSDTVPGDGCYQYTLTGIDNVGNQAIATSTTVKVDATPPTDGLITANGSGSNSYNTNGAVSLSKTNYTDAASGIASNAITRASGTLSGNSCGTISGATPVSTPSDSGLSTGCYRYTLTGTDNAGNQDTTQSAIVKVDTSAPSVSVGTLTSTTSGGSLNCQYINGTSIWYSTTNSNSNSCASASGNWTVPATASDADTGMLKVNFDQGGDDVGPGPSFSKTINWANGTNTSGAQTVTAFNNANNTATASYGATLDNAAPSGGVTTPSAGPISGSVTPASTSALDNGGGSGVKSVAYYYCSGSCATSPPGVGWTLIGTGTSGPNWTSGAAWDTSTVLNGTFTIKAVITDNVGNQVVTAGVSVTVNNPNRLVITSTAVSGAAASNANLGPITVQQQTANGTPVNAGASFVVTLSGPAGSSFATTQFGAPVTTVTIPNGQSSVTFWYGNTNTGTPTITASRAGLTSGTQQETITTAPAGLGIIITGGSGTPVAVCGAISTTYTCTVTGTGNGGHVDFYVTFVNSSGTQVVYSATQASTINETGQNTGSVSIGANASSSNPNTLTASHTGSSSKTSTLAFGPYILNVTVT